MSEPRVAPVRPDLVWFRGPDTIRFLNDLISQEIGALAPGSVARSMLLGPRGKLDHLLWVLRGEEEVGLLTDEGRGAELSATLGRYRIRVKVEIDEPVSGSLMVGGPAAEPGWVAGEGGVEAVLGWGGPPLRFVQGSVPEAPALALTEWDAIRIEAGEPRFGVDVDESTIPQETGLVGQTVDFTKGCFLGQELVARIDTRGRVNRHLRRLTLEGEVSAGQPILAGGQEVGTLTSVAGNLGLALVHREVEPGDRVLVGEVPALIAG